VTARQLPPRWRLLLIVAARAFGRAPFTAADLAVAAWKANPRAFGLAGYEDRHPDAGSVRARLTAELMRRGLVEQLATSTFRVSDAGAALAATPEAPRPIFYPFLRPQSRT
jgi:hypothetical protein